jgi:hypothetical protein
VITVAVVTIELDHVAGCGVGPGYIFELDRLHGLCENTGVEVQVVRPPYPSGSLVRKGAEDTVHA